MKYKTFLFLCFIPFWSWGQTFALNYQADEIRPSVRRIAHKMSKIGDIHNEAIGFSGSSSKQYELFVRLMEKATISELVLLVEHPHVAVRGYAFWGLAIKDYPDLERVLLAHAMDEEMVFEVNGCTGGEGPLIDFMINVVWPRRWDTNCKKLDKKVLKKVQAKRAASKSSED